MKNAVLPTSANTSKAQLFQTYNNEKIDDGHIGHVVINFMEETSLKEYRTQCCVQNGILVTFASKYQSFPSFEITAFN
jgi:hypothetical protein